MSCKKPELLAPAGSIESFHAAIEGGADAIYLGLSDFNARLRAKNFTPATLSYLLPYARKRNVKLYVTMNTRVKQAELEPAIHLLHALDSMRIDAIIAADYGIIDIARRHFPRLRLHASTQMVIHNSAGVKQAQKLGLRRAILARELTVDEVKKIRAASSLELELFVHGALCYSVSGLCLASSYLGGSSGNRGRCTQVCRRVFSSGTGRGAYFSPRDFQALDALPAISTMGISCLKIEGRMKSPEYVYEVTRAYRMALDDPNKIPEAKEILTRDLGRKKTSFFLNGVFQKGIINATPDSGIGNLLGTIQECSGDKIIIATSLAVNANDRLRIQPKNGFEGEAAAVRHVSANNDQTIIVLKKAVHCLKDDLVYLISRHSADTRFNQTGVTGVEPLRFQRNCPFVKKALSSYSYRANQPHRDALWIKIDDKKWLDHLQATPCQHLIFSGDQENINALLQDSEQLRIWKSRLAIALPDFIPENELASWKAVLSHAAKSGIKTGIGSNIGHAELFGTNFTLIADSNLAGLSSASQQALLKNGFSRFVYSTEDDYLNMKAHADQRGMAYLFARPPLFVSRITPAIAKNRIFSDTENNRFFSVMRNNLWYTLPEKPFAITHRREKLSDADIHDFILDLSFYPADAAFLRMLIDSYKNYTRLPNSGVFNFKAGLK